MAHISYLARILLVASLIAGPSIADDSPPSLDQLRRAIVASEQAVSSFRVHVRSDNKKRHDLADEFANTWQESVFCADQHGRLRVERKGVRASTLPPRQPLPYRRISVFDGEIARTMSGPDKFNHGNIGNISVANIGIDPRNFLFLYFKRRIANDLATDGKFESPRWFDLDGQSLVEVTSKPTVRSGNAFRARLLFAPQHGLYPVYKAAEIKPLEADDWREYSRTTVDNLTQQGQVWLPAKVTVRSWYAPAKSLKSPKPLPVAWVYKVSLTNWELDPAFDDSTFKLDFPAGLKVLDHRTGKTNAVPAKSR